MKSMKKEKQDFSELVEYLDKKFSEDAKEHRLMRDEFTGLSNEFRELQGAVDAYAKRADAYFQEMVMLSHQVDRHDRWLRQIAEKVGVKLKD